MDVLPTMPARHCPQCDAQVDPAAKYCWLCNAKLSPSSAGAARQTPLQAQLVDSNRPFQFGISSLLLVITFVAILCSVVKMNPGLGIVVAVLTVPAVLRTVLVAFRQQQGGKPMSAAGKTGVFMLTMAMSLCVAVAACAAFCFTFFFTCLAAAAGKGGGFQGDPFTPAFIIGGIVAAAVAILVTFVFWRVLRRDRIR
jgi:hypothetical protein